MISFACESCQKKLSAREALAGKKVKCPRCGKAALVPSAVVVAPADARPPPSSASVPPSRQAASELATVPPCSPADPTQSPHSGDAEHDPSLTDFLAPPQADDELGRLGGFRILKILGHGGMGVVSQGEDLKLGRTVAIKAMLPYLAGSKTGQERFLREARAAAALEHDHIVAIHHVGEDRGAPFIVMPFLKGEALDCRLQRDEPLQLAEVLRIGREIAEGLAAAHDRGLIHRDIKPANVWLEAPRQRVKILDFGLARAAEDNAHLTQSGAIMGTPAYMAPEQAGAEKVDARCDLWSLGVVLYRLCTGALPFNGSDTMSTLMAVAGDDPPPPAKIDAAVPKGLSNLVMQLLEKDPAKRPASAHEVVGTLRALEREIADLPTTDARNAPLGERTRVAVPAPGRKPPRRMLFVVGGVAAAALVLLLGALVLFWPTPQGTVCIEIDDPDIKVTFDKDGPTITGADKDPIRLKPGDHDIVVTRGDFTFETDKFVLKKGETVALKVVFLDGKVQVVKDGVAFAEKAAAPGRVAVAPPPVQKKNDTPPPTFKNSLGIEFVLVPRGKSWLGGGGGKPGDREVQIEHDFYLGKYEVTQEEWQKVTGQTPSHFSRTGLGKDAVKEIPSEILKRFPVEQVSRDDAQLFLKELNRRAKEEGWVYRLPKEAEWEYACRGGPSSDKFDSTFDFYLDKPANQVLPDQANFAHENSLKRTCKVGSYLPNRLGLYDMHGNVWELCDDTEKAADGAPRALSRGGCWGQPPAWSHLVERYAWPPSHRDLSIGLRLARVAIGKEPIAPKPPEATKPGDDARIKQIAALPSAKQLDAVATWLKELNPGFDGKMTPTVKDGRVIGLHFLTYLVANISPLRALPHLVTLDCSGFPAGEGKLADLSPLKEMKLTRLAFHHTKVADLSPLKGMKLTFLNCGITPLIDLSPLQDMKLTTLFCNGTKVSDLSPLKGMPLTELNCGGTMVSDLSPLKDMKLTKLWCNASRVSDLSPLKGMPLTNFSCTRTRVTDLSPLKGMPLKTIYCNFKRGRDTEVLRSLTTLEMINNKPASEFWKEEGP